MVNEKKKKKEGRKERKIIRKKKKKQGQRKGDGQSRISEKKNEETYIYVHN